ncbi:MULTISPECIES: hypothetical protein [Streptomyces]|uniref:Uncharacterized protein n=2 Tax=Streptomyces TaxID=1883 RepID=A0ABV9J549_9ACTN
MLLWSVSRELLGLALGSLAQARFGTAGLVLLIMLGAGVRARHNGLAVTAAVALMILVSQA